MLICVSLRNIFALQDIKSSDDFFILRMVVKRYLENIDDQDTMSSKNTDFVKFCEQDDNDKKSNEFVEERSSSSHELHDGLSFVFNSFITNDVQQQHPSPASGQHDKSPEFLTMKPFNERFLRRRTRNF